MRWSCYPILSRLGIYFITCIYRANVAFYVRACVSACGVPVEKPPIERDPYACTRVREFVAMCVCVCMWENERTNRYDKSKQREMCKGIILIKPVLRRGKHATSGKSSEKNRQTILTHLIRFIYFIHIYI